MSPCSWRAASEPEAGLPDGERHGERALSSGIKRCIIILSDKSSGSSALQRHLTAISGVNHIAKTRHFEFESLYWTKAASVLGRPQERMRGSEVPLAAGAAESDLRQLLADNAPLFEQTSDIDHLVFQGWRALCTFHGPVFVEKSPHHLHQWASLELIMESTRRLPDVEFFLVGLVRNPMDTLYSMWRRWRLDPTHQQFEWARAYRNLQRLATCSGQRLCVFRYEDMVGDPTILAPVYRFCGLTGSMPRSASLHSRSLRKWQEDFLFGFRLHHDVRQLAHDFGYTQADLHNRPRLAWPISRPLLRATHAMRQSTIRSARRILAATVTMRGHR